MDKELETHTTEYGGMFGSEYQFQLYNCLNFFGKEAPLQNGMIIPDTCVLIASRYNVVLHCFSRHAITMYLSLPSTTPPAHEHIAIPIGLVYVRICAKYKRVHDVEGDGHCGFRVITSCLGLHHEWYQIRVNLMEELETHTTEYGDMFGSEYRFQLYNYLSFFGKEAPLQNWMGYVKCQNYRGGDKKGKGVGINCTHIVIVHNVRLFGPCGWY
uniref:OTU domain-containing protein n=1 Tax=Lactuca sativa TaxID=4236 RepID=A0A9R1VJG2_LACSA|nr:hypothetical protein LSAT_V11C500247080 [Lactuca sativa]